MAYASVFFLILSKVMAKVVLIFQKVAKSEKFGAFSNPTFDSLRCSKQTIIRPI